MSKSSRKKLRENYIRQQEKVTASQKDNKECMKSMREKHKIMKQAYDSKRDFITK